MEVASLIQSAVFLSCAYRICFDGVIASPLRASEVKVTSNFLLDEDSHSLSPLTDGLLKFVPAASGPVAMAPEAGVAFILAANRTRRPDVLEKFRPYKGGWDMTNKHYWASVSFTGATGFILAVVWLTSFAVALIAPLLQVENTFHGESFRTATPTNRSSVAAVVYLCCIDWLCATICWPG
ncbi:hypothetical protein HPP92_004418 [Vanilla planifolia]|uniref:Uncharacterized protein n=1 Tax=Vanilla planifolia TaxID=51239 RepID=A0A835RQC0_VANPL|nr:hypothetical protein HPP92_004418 [Vanilla planifolia]